MNINTIAKDTQAFKEYKEYWPVMMKADLLSRRATSLYDEMKEFRLKWHHTIYDKSIKNLRQECTSIDQEIELLLSSLDSNITKRMTQTNPIVSISCISISTSKNLNTHTMRFIDELQKKNTQQFFIYSIPILTILFFIYSSVYT